MPSWSDFPDPPTADESEKMHQNSDVDVKRTSMHHTIGLGTAQAAAGDHNHDGTNGVLLLTGLTITGSRGGNAALPSIIACLVRLGATDSSTA